jgi:hypothetical protein
VPAVAALPALALLTGAVCGAVAGLPAWPAPWILSLGVAGAAVAYVCERRAAFVLCAAAAFCSGAAALASDGREATY